tara:strand:+ start:213 stop:626 length:414 start_codon:yes stop_codon:yes gene_type:complete
MTVFRAAITMSSNDFKLFLNSRKQLLETGVSSCSSSSSSSDSTINQDDYYNSLDVCEQIMYTDQDYNINCGSTLYDILRDNPFKTNDLEPTPDSFYDSVEYIRMIEEENKERDDYDSDNGNETDYKSSSDSEDDEWF